MVSTTRAGLKKIRPEFLADYGFDDDETVHSVFRAIVADPASYLPYCIGYMEFKELREDTEETMGDDFDLTQFHQCILNVGPCSFDILENIYKKIILMLDPPVQLDIPLFNQLNY